MKFLLYPLFICLAGVLIAQDKVQKVKGKVLDKDNRLPLVGVTIFVLDTEPMVGTSSDENGNFTLENVPVGRPRLKAQYVGYQDFVSPNLIVTMGKEVYIDIELSEAIVTTEEVVVTASGNQLANQPLNEVSVVSTRSFSVEETQRYPSSINDPGRMAVAFPGVQANQENENEIVVRGNSAMGVLWRVEGLDIPNPNHFARVGSSGGGITVFSASLLNNADFSTGAFAAEYGNAFSSVFDMRFRKGNQNKREYTFRAGIIGLDFATEGPIQKGRSSYLINYRYSTLGLLGAMGLYVVRENVANNFQDLSFNIAFNSKDNRTVFTVFGMGGLSNEHWFTKKDTADWVSILDYREDKNGSNLGVLGTTLTRTINEKSFLKLVLGTVVQDVHLHQYEPRIDSPSIRKLVNSYNYLNTNINLHATYSLKISNRLKMKMGYIGTALLYKYYYGALINTNIGFQTFLNNLQGVTFLNQLYAQSTYQFNSKLTANVGIHAQYLTLNNTYSIEPRVSLKYAAGKNTTLSLGYGLHGKMMPLGTYLLTFQDSLGNNYQPNTNLKMAQEHHLVLSFQQIIAKNIRVQVEGYFQYLYNVPIVNDRNSIFWFYNQRDNYGYMPMISKGLGRNFGVDIVVEKGFDKGWFFLATSSIFSSKYKVLDNVWRNTRMNSQWTVSTMVGKEFTFQKGGILQLGWKMFVNGGLRYTPIDSVASLEAGQFVPDETKAFQNRVGTYFRMDVRIAYRKNADKLTYIVALDVQNVTNRKNLKDYLYNRQTYTQDAQYHSGLLPVISFQIDF